MNHPTNKIVPVTMSGTERVPTTTAKYVRTVQPEENIIYDSYILCIQRTQEMCN